MIRSLMIGLVAGARSMTAVAAVGAMSRPDGADEGNAPARLLTKPVVARTLAVLAAAEVLGDKLPFAPDRTIAPAILVRIVTGGLAGAALAPPGERRLGGVVGAVGAVAGAYLTLPARTGALRRLGQIGSGAVEDAMAAGLALWLVRTYSRDRAGSSSEI